MAEVTALVDAYQAGASVNDLVIRYRVHRTTVTRHLHRLGGATRRRGLDDRQVDRAIRLYQQGRSLSRIGARLGVHAETVRQALLSHGIQMRRPWERT